MDSQVFSAFGREVEKIARGSDDSDKDLRKHLMRGAGAGVLAQMGFSGLAQNSIQNGRKMTDAEAAEFAKYHKEHHPDVKITTKRPKGLDGPAYAPRSKLIYSPHTAHPSILAHEMGHASGVGRHLKSYIQPIQHLYRMGHGAAVVATAIGGQRWAMKGKTEKERDERLKKLQIGSAAGGAAALPLLAEEGRASLRAVNLGRKLGKGGEYARHLLPAFGTYAAIPVGLTAGSLYGLHKLRESNRKKKN
jgi:hypothetical protein